MKTIELFAGTGSFSKVAKELGHDTFKVDNNPAFDVDMLYDLERFPTDRDMPIGFVNLWDKIKESDIIWMSPPCTTFSMASGNKHWTANRKPKTQEGIVALNLIENCKGIADYCIKTNKIFFIENPRARARWFLPVEWRKTVWYCKYGDKRAKPTDIWTNLKNWQPKQCHNGNKDCHHEPAPRGSKTGTQGLKGAKERGIVPRELILEIFKTVGDFEK